MTQAASSPFHTPASTKPIPDEFIVGFGIDYAPHYRHLPYIGKVMPE